MTAVDLGAAPGGWSWQLIRRGIKVIAIDNGPLKGAVLGHPLVEHLRVDGFRYRPRRPVDWLVCDVACYPRRLLALVQRWMESGRVGNMVCTVKFQGATDHDAARAFAAIPGSVLVHLHHNKHELTFMWPA